MHNVLVFKSRASELTCLGHLDQFVIAEFVEVLLHLRDGLCDRAEGEVGVDSDRWQLLRRRLGYQHVVALQGKKTATIRCRPTFNVFVFPPWYNVQNGGRASFLFTLLIHIGTRLGLPPCI